MTRWEVYEDTAFEVRRLLRAFGVSPADVDDLCQEVFLVALRRMPEDLEDRRGRRLWLAQVCRYVAAQFRRRAHRRHERVVGDSELEARASHSAPSADEDLDAGHLEASLHEVLSKLPADDSELLAFHVAGGLSFRALAEICGCDPKTVRKRYGLAGRRAQQLGKALEARAEPLFRARFVEAGASGRSASGPSDRTDESGAERERQSGSHLIPHGPEPCGDEAVTVATEGAILIAHWHGRVTQRSLDLIESASERLRRSGRFSYLAINEPTSPVPGRLERARILELFRRYREDVQALGNVVRYPFVAPIITAIATLARAPFPVRFERSLEAACQWLVTEADRAPGGSGTTPAQLQAAAEAVMGLSRDSPSRRHAAAGFAG